MLVTQLEVGSMRNYAYVIGDVEGGSGAIIDPSAELDRLEAEVSRLRLTLRYVFNTHSHYDHIGGNSALRAKGAKLVAHPRAPTKPDVPVRDRETLWLGSLPVDILYTPGHAFDAICIKADGYLFTGDTLFIGECGRVDLPGSDPRAMHHSLLTTLASLPDELVVMPGHNYGPMPRRTLGEEKQHNYTLVPRSFEDFLAFMVAP